ncbi:MAG: VanZ family protein [Deltaproteobacteria bacterium]|nr:VanZ family protein [Deltaproteobacteria bacterium]
MMTFVRNRGFYKKRYIVAAVAVCFALSLAREVLQSWIPSRSSDCLDLVLNTLGTLLGAMIFVWGYARVRA